MSKFVYKRQLLSEEAPKKPEEITDIDVCNKSACKKPSLVNVGTRTKMEFASALQTDSKEMKFRKESLRFYQVPVQYLLDYLPLKRKIIKQAQYLHPTRRRDIASTCAMSNAALSIVKVVITLRLIVLFYTIKNIFAVF